MCVCACVCVHVHLCACMEARTQPQVLLLGIIYFFLETGSLSSPELPMQTRLAVQWALMHLLSLSSLALGLQTHTAMPGFLCGWCRWLSGPHSWELDQQIVSPALEYIGLLSFVLFPPVHRCDSNSCLLAHSAVGVLRSQGEGHQSSFCEPRDFLTTNSHQRSSLDKSQVLMKSALVSPLWLSPAFLCFVSYHPNVPLGHSHHMAVLRMLHYALGYFFPPPLTQIVNYYP